jgi:hypothetical protein
VIEGFIISTNETCCATREEATTAVNAKANPINIRRPVQAVCSMACARPVPTHPLVARTASFQRSAHSRISDNLVGRSLTRPLSLVVAPHFAGAPCDGWRRQRRHGDGRQQSGERSGGDDNTATTTGNGSSATTGDGNNNTATTIGDNSSASANFGDRNTASTTGNGSTANANFGNDNAATVAGDGSSANAFGGNHNIATVEGDDCAAVASSPTGCSANVSGDGGSASCPQLRSLSAPGCPFKKPR